MQPGQQVPDPLVAHRAHGAHVDLGGDGHIVENDPLQLGLLVVELKNSKVDSQLVWFSEPSPAAECQWLRCEGVLAGFRCSDLELPVRSREPEGKSCLCHSHFIIQTLTK